MSQLSTFLKSGARIPGADNIIERIVIGLPGCPTELLIYRGRIYVYNTLGQTLIDGGYIAARAFAANIISAEKLAVGAKKYVHNIIWTATDENTCSWSAGTITFADGSSVNINAGNTGNIVNKNYIYYNGSSTLQKTEIYSSTVGGGNIPLAIIEPVASGKCIITPFLAAGTTINGDLITTGKIQSGSGKTYFDLNNNLFVVNDGINDRVLIGKMGTAWGIKVSLPGYDASIDTNINHFALWATSDDTEDNILIKESTRASTSVGASSHVHIAHGLAYVPLVFVFVEETANTFIKCYGQPFDSRGFWYDIDTTNLTLYNTTAGAKTFKYYIFYDQMV